MAFTDRFERARKDIYNRRLIGARSQRGRPAKTVVTGKD
jgi:hypothetical protein